MIKLYPEFVGAEITRVLVDGSTATVILELFNAKPIKVTLIDPPEEWLDNITLPNEELPSTIEMFKVEDGEVSIDLPIGQIIINFNGADIQVSDE